MKKVTKYIIIAVLLVALTSCKKITKDKTEEVDTTNNQSYNVTITLEEYDKLEEDMSLEEVKKIIGGNCNKVETNKYYCSGDFAGTSATLVFENDKLKEKTQTDLK